MAARVIIRRSVEPGTDFISAGAGNDSLFGGSGIDVLRGGLGKDQFYGGRGSDDFVFDDEEASSAYSNRDAIFDFQKSADDLDIHLIDANVAISGDQAFAYSGTSAQKYSV